MATCVWLITHGYILILWIRLKKLKKVYMELSLAWKSCKVWFLEWWVFHHEISPITGSTAAVSLPFYNSRTFISTFHDHFLLFFLGTSLWVSNNIVSYMKDDRIGSLEAKQVRCSYFISLTLNCGLSVYMYWFIHLMAEHCKLWCLVPVQLCWREENENARGSTG